MDRTKILIGILLIDFVALLLWTFTGQIGLLEGIKNLVSDRWSLATVADLTFGLILMSILVYYNEKGTGRRISWILSFFLLGNIGPALYLLLHLESIKGKLQSTV
jgi:hypothetical protein